MRCVSAVQGVKRRAGVVPVWSQESWGCAVVDDDIEFGSDEVLAGTVKPIEEMDEAELRDKLR